MKPNWKITLAVFAVSLASQALHAAPPVGAWSANCNGFTGPLSITSVDAAGNAVGTMFGNPIKGLWNESAQELMFYRAIGGTFASTPPELIQVYTLYQFPGASGTLRLAGFFEAFAGTGATAVRHRFGCYAAK